MIQRWQQQQPMEKRLLPGGSAIAMAAHDALHVLILAVSDPASRSAPCHAAVHAVWRLPPRAE
jgi:hypothetical protein